MLKLKRESKMKKHFVTFLSPGTFVAEDTTKSIASWNVDKAKEMASAIIERYGATPYCFYFTTRERTDKDFDSKETAKSSMYFLGGKVLTLQEVKKQMPDAKILISNMECNHIKKVIVNNNSWQWIQPFGDKDQVVDFKPVKTKAK
jgi:hypothetical protein